MIQKPREEDDFYEDVYSPVRREDVDLPIDLFNRLTKLKIINPGLQTKTFKDYAALDSIQSQNFRNGYIFSQYLLVLK